MSDTIIRGVARNGAIRFFVAKTTDTVEKARVIHDTFPATSAALGRVMSIGAIMGTALKNDDEKLVLEIRSDGDLKHILVDTDRNGFVRGLVSNPSAHGVNESNGKLDVGGIIGKGNLQVTYKRNDVTTFSSQVELQTGEIGEDFAFYFAQSEQIPSAVSVGVLVNEDYSILSAGSILIQVLPHASEEDIEVVETILSKLQPVSNLMVDNEALDVALNLFEDAVIMETTPVDYHCGCNRDQMLRALKTLENDDLKTFIEEDHGATLRCHYCNESYHFDEKDLQAIINERN